MKIKGSFT